MDELNNICPGCKQTFPWDITMEEFQKHLDGHTVPQQTAYKLAELERMYLLPDKR